MLQAHTAQPQTSATLHERNRLLNAQVATTETQVTALAQASERDKQALAELMQQLSGHTSAVYAISPCETCADTVQHLKGIAAQNDVEDTLMYF